MLIGCGRKLYVLLLLAAACSRRREPEPSTTTVRDTIEMRSRAVLEALKAQDENRFAALVHPTKGVRFSPYAYVRGDADVLIRREQIPGIFASSAKRVWGVADGSGALLDTTFSGYYYRFVYNADFLNAPRVAYDAPPLHSGNTPSNLATVYPRAHRIEYHFAGFDPRYDGMDWSSLWLVFEKAGDLWYLVAVVHGSWTI
jgi:hypothetical protein